MQAAAPPPEVQAEGLVARYLTPATDNAPTTWTDAYADGVAQRRKDAVGGHLFVDRWLQDAGLSITLFPPRSVSDLFVLVVEILSSVAPMPTRHALLLYLALEQATDPSLFPDAAHALAESQAMPPSEVQDVRAYWAMDHGHLEVRLPLLIPSTRCTSNATRPIPLWCWNVWPRSRHCSFRSFNCTARCHRFKSHSQLKLCGLMPSPLWLTRRSKDWCRPGTLAAPSSSRSLPRPSRRRASTCWVRFCACALPHRAPT